MKTHSFLLRYGFIAALGFSIQAAAGAENWPQWRGAKLDGVSQETNLPTTWSKTENVVWRLPLAGPAGSTPAIWGDRIFLTTADGSDLKLLGISTAGEKLWEQTLGSGNSTARGDEGNSASNSPCTDGKHVWAMFTTGPLGCYDFDGHEVWKIDLQERYGKFNIAFGMTSTPVLDGDHLYLQLLHTDGAWVVCLNKADGQEVWKHNRQSDAKGEPLHAYASPMLYRDGQREYLLTHGADYIVAHRLTDGEEIWRCGGMNPPPNGAYRQDFRFVASPLAVPGLIVVPSCKNGVVLALDPAAKGNITGQSSYHHWTHDKTPDVPSPLYHEGLVYLCSEGGIMTCLHAKTGKPAYIDQRVHAQRHRASPVYADGKIYLTARDGVVSVLRAGPEFELLASNDLEEGISASPAISGGRIYFRTNESLFAIGEK
ncbi:MAG: PQQ-binding-like beta-propeller repeat protein [Pirellulales bacterium]